MQMRHDKSSIAKKVGKVLMSFKSPSKEHPEVTYTLLAENNQNQQQKETSYANLLRRLKYWLAVPLILFITVCRFRQRLWTALFNNIQFIPSITITCIRK